MGSGWVVSHCPGPSDRFLAPLIRATCKTSSGKWHADAKTDAGQLLTFSLIILLRCTVECSDDAIAQTCASSIHEFWAKLQDSAENEGWDIAAMCISRCAEPMRKIFNRSSLLPSDVVSLGQGEHGEDGTLQTRCFNSTEGDADATVEELVPRLFPVSNLDTCFGSQSDEVDIGFMSLPLMDHGFDFASLEC